MPSPHDPPDADRADQARAAAVTRVSAALPAAGHQRSAESRAALDLYRAEDTTGTEVREAALLLARLRSRADSRRDTYLRAALG